MLEMVPGFHTQKIVEEIFRLSENTSKSAPSSDNTRFDWLEKYINSDAGMECLPKYYTVLSGMPEYTGTWGFVPIIFWQIHLTLFKPSGTDYAHQSFRDESNQFTNFKCCKMSCQALKMKRKT